MSIFFLPLFLMRGCKKSLFRLFLLEAEQYQSVTANYHCLVSMIYYYVNKIACSEIKMKKAVRSRVFPELLLQIHHLQKSHEKIVLLLNSIFISQKVLNSLK